MLETPVNRRPLRLVNSEVITMTSFYHVCFAVDDIEAAMADLTAVAGTEWGQIRSDTLGEWSYHIVLSRDTPHIELIQGSPGSPWAGDVGSHFHHLGWWTHSLIDTADRLNEAGLPTTFDGCPIGRRFAYHRMDSIGGHVEIVDVAARKAFQQTWNPDGPPADALR